MNRGHHLKRIVCFYYHPSEDCIVLSHALFRVLSKKMSERSSKMTDVRNGKGKLFVNLRQYEKEMLSALLTEDDCFSEFITRIKS